MQVFATEQAYWEGQGSENPWWAVLTNRSLGVDIPIEEKLSFYDTGIGAVEEMKSHFAELSMKPVWAGRAMDLGCGLGRMSNALSALGFEDVLCVDQAPSFLAAAQKALSELDGRGAIAKGASKSVKFVHSGPDLSCQVQPGTVDFVHSILTLQHMKPQLQVAYIEQMCDALKVNGIGYLGIPIGTLSWLYEGNRESVHCSMDWENPSMMMHYTEEAEVGRHLASRGCSVVGVVDRNDIGTNFGEARRFIFRRA